jgi:quinol-cytochrome oxidoreductase complex cytochrome b subunit
VGFGSMIMLGYFPVCRYFLYTLYIIFDLAFSSVEHIMRCKYWIVVQMLHTGDSMFFIAGFMHIFLRGAVFFRWVLYDLGRWILFY